jgi:predicted ATPase
MLKRLFIKNFTVFAEADFEFGPGLNIVVGTNGTGKSHVLKLGYSVAKTSHRVRRTRTLQSKGSLQRELATDLQEVFRAEGVGHLTRYSAGKERTEVLVDFSQEGARKIGFAFSSSSKIEVALEGNVPREFAENGVVMIPAKELLSMFPGLNSLVEEYQLALDTTYTDLSRRLATPLKRTAQSIEIKQVLEQLQVAMGGTLKQEHGRFYFYPQSGGKLEIDLVAEGLRKLATLAQLLSNGGLHQENTLFWDEPEANLNPALLRKLALVLVELVKQGFQIILATHSLFLLKELHILSRQQGERPLPLRYFGLNTGGDGATTVTTVDDFEELPDIVALDVQLEQNGLFLDVLNGTK